MTVRPRPFVVEYEVRSSLRCCRGYRSFSDWAKATAFLALAERRGYVCSFINYLLLQ